MLLPFHFLYQMSAWTRAIVVSLAIVHAANPRRPVPAGFNLDEIWLPGVSPEFHHDARWFTWHNFFLLTDRLLKWWERSGIEVGAPQGRREGQGVDDRAHAPLRWPGRDLPAHDVLGDGARCAGLRARTIRCAPKRCGCSTSFVVDDGERFFFQPCFSPVWDTAIGAYALAQSDPGTSALRSRGRLAARPGSPAQGRLVGEAARHRALRLGFLLQERVVSGHRRHRHGDAGAQRSGRLGCRAAQQACHKRRSRLAARHAIERWRLGRLRRRQQLGVSQQHSVRRSQRHARPHLPGYHRARAGSAGGPRCGSRTPRGAARRGLAGAASAGRRKLVRPLGRGLHLRHLFRAARAGGVAAKATARRTSCAPANGCARFRTPTADGAKAAPATTTAPSPPAHSTPSQTAWAILGLIAGGDANSLSVQPRHRIPARNPASRRKLGRGAGHRHRFPQGFLSQLPPLQGLFPATRAVFVREGPSNSNGKLMKFPYRYGGRHGRVHFQEQDAAAARVAEERRGGARRHQPVPHPARQDRRRSGSRTP